MEKFSRDQYSDVISFWGDNRVLWDAADLEGFPLSAEVRQFLADVGLPAGVDWTLRFVAKDVKAVQTVEGCFVIGDDSDNPICIVEKTEHVLCMEEARGRFMNASLAQLARCLVAFQEYRLAVRDMDDRAEEIERIIDSTESRMMSVDPEAMDDTENYWPVIVEQMRDGFL
jgi:hypothetical protein